VNEKVSDVLPRKCGVSGKPKGLNNLDGLINEFVKVCNLLSRFMCYRLAGSTRYYSITTTQKQAASGRTG
jgi:hypothetical protein